MSPQAEKPGAKAATGEVSTLNPGDLDYGDRIPPEVYDIAAQIIRFIVNLDEEWEPNTARSERHE